MAAANLDRLDSLLCFLLDVSQRELAGETLTLDDYVRINFYGGELEAITLAAADAEGEGWTPFFEQQEQAALVADVATDPTRQVLVEAIGRVFEIYRSAFADLEKRRRRRPTPGAKAPRQADFQSVPGAAENRPLKLAPMPLHPYPPPPCLRGDRSMPCYHRVATALPPPPAGGPVPEGLWLPEKTPSPPRLRGDRWIPLILFVSCCSSPPACGGTGPCLLAYVLIEHYFNLTTTLTSACPASGKGTTLPSTGLPSTARATSFPGPRRSTVMR